MTVPITRRTFLSTGAAAAGAFLPGVAAYAGRHPTHGVRFTLNAEVLDGGEQIISITLHTARLGPIDPAGAGSRRGQQYRIVDPKKAPGFLPFPLVLSWP